MANRTAYFGTLVIFVAAAFFVGLVTGVNYGRSSVGPAEPHAAGAGHSNHTTGQGADVPQNQGDEGAPAEVGAQGYPQAPDFSLEEPGTGETVELSGFAGSQLVLLITTTT